MDEEAYDQKRAQYARFLSSSTFESHGRAEEIRCSPLFSLKVMLSAGSGAKTPSSSASESSEPVEEAFPQYGLLGASVEANSGLSKQEPIFFNVEAPTSAFLCGSQGSGKSYTLACLLESCLLPNDATGRLIKPLAGVVFHYDVDASSSVAEAASLATRGIKVRVLVSRSNEATLREAYSRLPGSESITVEPMLLNDSHLNIANMYKLMAVSEEGGPVPLYMEVINRILRDMAISGEPFNLHAFKATLAGMNMLNNQQVVLQMRLSLLESFMAKSATKYSKRAASVNVFETKPGEVCIVDLSDPLINGTTACLLFELCLGLFKDHRPPSGLIITCDEAHKYLGEDSAAAASFTGKLLTTIREQRHNATRVVISTQEPTLSSDLLDLCAISIVHRFTSPAWFAAIRDHLGGASKLLTADEDRKELFRQIVELNVGESLVFSPSSFVCLREDGMPRKLGASRFKMQTRLREGADAGKSKMATDGDMDESPEIERGTTGMLFDIPYRRRRRG